MKSQEEIDAMTPLEYARYMEVPSKYKKKEKTL